MMIIDEELPCSWATRGSCDRTITHAYRDLIVFIVGTSAAVYHQRDTCKKQDTSRVGVFFTRP